MTQDAIRQLRFDLQDAQHRAYSMGLPITARAINQAMNKITAEVEANAERARARARRERIENDKNAG
jgi:hypothetical protein